MEDTGILRRMLENAVVEPHRDNGPAAEMWISENGILLNVESPETGRCATVNLSELVANMPGPGGAVFQQWSDYYVEKFRAGRRAGGCDGNVLDRTE